MPVGRGSLMRWAARIGIGGLCALSAACAPAAMPSSPIKLIAGSFTPSRQPDGNTVIFEDATGLIVIDTGRHLDHQARILAYAKERGKPVRAIVNTHWHLDHSGGNQELRQIHPGAKLYTSYAVIGALEGFLARSLAAARAKLADPKVSAADKAEIKLGVDAITNRKDLVPDIAVTGDMTLPHAGKGLELHLASHAATEGDTWIYDPDTRTLVAGDLVVLPIPFFDTACAEGWRRALDALSKVPFTSLVPGHGPVLTRGQFELYRKAFDRLIDCSEGSAAAETCILGWQQDAAPLLRTGADREAVRPYLSYYLREVLRAPAKQAEYCGSGAGG